METTVVSTRMPFEDYQEKTVELLINEITISEWLDSLIEKDKRSSHVKDVIHRSVRNLRNKRYNNEVERERQTAFLLKYIEEKL